MKNSLLLPLIFVITGSANAESPYFSSRDFALCVAAELNSQLTPSQLNERMQAIDTLRQTGADELLASTANGTFMPGILSHLVPYSQKDMAEVMSFHSVPLVDYEKINWGREQTSEDLLGRLEELYRSLNSDETTNLVNMSEPMAFLDEKVPARQFPGFIEGNDKVFVQMMFAQKILSDRLIRFLINSPRESLTHFELFKKAVELYDGEVLTALGVIGTIFDFERLYAKQRDKRLILASRLVPLFADSNDKFGDNYHFWLYLNAALQGKHRVAKVMSMTYEGFQGDFQDMRADNFGLAAGKIIRSKFGRPTTCRLTVR